MHYDLGYFDLEQKPCKPSTIPLSPQSLPPMSPAHSDQDPLFDILGMIATCLAALSGQPPKPEGARPLARGVDGDSARRAIMAMP
jgi:hypothetical protein